MTLTETPTALTIAALSSANLMQLYPLLINIGWEFEIVDSAGECADQSMITPDYELFIVTIEKPKNSDVLQIVTISGLRDFLVQERNDLAWEIATLTTPFATMSTNFLPWGSSSIFIPAPATKSPRQLVKDHSVSLRVPGDIRIWMLRASASEQLWCDLAFQAFADLSAQALMRALAAEIKSDGSLLFKGPPHTQLNPPRNGAAKELKLDGYNALRTAAAWVYENGAEAEQRHGLFTAEFGRTHPTETEPAIAFARISPNVLEGARLAYQLSLSDLTREAIKAQGDLRKAVADDTAKLADNTRQVVTSVAAALAACIGLIATKIGTTAPHWALQGVAIIAAVYVASIVVSGWIFMRVQQDMRRKWRSRLYRFIPDVDYKAMVLDPCQRAETMFTITAVGGGIVAAIAILLVFLAP